MSEDKWQNWPSSLKPSDPVDGTETKYKQTKLDGLDRMHFQFCSVGMRIESLLIPFFRLFEALLPVPSRTMLRIRYGVTNCAWECRSYPEGHVVYAKLMKCRPTTLRTQFEELETVPDVCIFSPIRDCMMIWGVFRTNPLMNFSNSFLSCCIVILILHMNAAQ